MSIRLVHCFKIVSFLVLLMVPSLVPTSVLALPERTWNRTFAVKAGDRHFVTGGIDFASNIEVRGTVKVQSCCGFSTDDIDFFIRGVDHPGQSFGVVVDTYTFGWNSGLNDRYDFIFDNEWVVCGGTPFTCARNETSPSYHDKKVELTVGEDAPFAPYVLTVSRVLLPLVLVGLAVFLFGLFAFLRGRMRKS